MSPTPDVTVLLRAWLQGDETALDALMPLVHHELRHIARRCLRGERANHSPQATDLARSRGADKRGGGVMRVVLDDAAIGGASPDADVIRLDDALQALAAWSDGGCPQEQPGNLGLF